VFEIDTDGDFVRNDGGHDFVNKGLVRKMAGTYDVPRTLIGGTGEVLFTGDGSGVLINDLSLTGGAIGGVGVAHVYGDLEWTGGTLGIKDGSRRHQQYGQQFWRGF